MAGPAARVPPEARRIYAGALFQIERSIFHSYGLDAHSRGVLCDASTGMGGGDLVERNVLFNTCRESSDHGPINSWDRQPFLSTVRTGKPSMQMAWREVRNNILIANYGGSKEVDNDDGSLFYSGEWQDDEPHGFGKYHTPEGQVAYEGEIAAGP